MGVAMTLLPAPPDSGIVFRRTDVESDQCDIAATYDNVCDTRMCTRIRNASGVEVGTIEHLMAALAGVGIDNVIVQLDGAEVPVLDGSAAPFVFLIECAGVATQDVPRGAIEVLKPVSVTDGTRSASLSPGRESSLHLEIVFDHSLIGCQAYRVVLEKDVFKREVASARTFGFLCDVQDLKARGLARGGSLANAVVVDGNKVVNREGLRFADEFVRHKALDSIGDMYLAGAPLLGHYHGICTGHGLNQKLLSAMFADPTSWRPVHFDEADAEPEWPQREVAALA